jgi:tetratricopeptide (TPR) repeat protein/tRNA A-37 threonylcarbamoyl transferase component Bud32
MIGSGLGHYLIIEKIGAGGMGEVYRAHDEQLDRDVALKVLPAGMLADEAARRQFRKEALALARLNHPNIETVYEFASQDGVDFLALELIPGEALSEKVKSGPLALAEISRLALQLCEGLSAAHEQGIIHCDLKPHNIFVTPDGWLKILDFGLARRVHSEIVGDSTRSVSVDTATVSGTVPYMSPEQLSGQATDARTDIYSTGAVLYELATGQRAFPQTQGPQLMGAILHQEPAAAASVNPSISAGLDSIIRKAMEKTASQRYQTARELRVAIEGLTTAAVGSASWSGTAVRAPLSAKGKWTVGAIVAVLLGIGAALGFNIGGVRNRVPVLNRVHVDPVVKPGIPARPASIRPAVAVLGFKNLSGRPDEAWLSTALSEMLTTEVGAGEKVRTIPGETVSQLKVNLSLSDADSYGAATLQKIRASIGSDYVLLGSYLALGNGQVRLDLRLQNTQTGELLSSMSAQGSETEIAGLVSRIGATVRTKLGVGEVASSDAGMVQATLPANPEAARLYSEAIERLRNYDTSGALPLIQKALALEPKFALSHMVMSRVWSNLGYGSKAEGEAKTAFDLSGSLSRREQLSIEGRYRETTHEWSKAIEIYKALWNFYPDEVAPGLSLVSVQILASQLKDAQETVDALRNLHASGFDDIRIDINDARIAQTGGDFKKLLEIAQRTEAKAQALGARALRGDMLLMEARAYEYLGDPKKGEQASMQAKDLYAAIGDIAGVARAQNALANLLANEGNNKDARRLYEQALATSRKTGNKMEEAVELHNIAIILRDSGDLTAAKKMFLDALAINREIGNKVGQAETLNSLANISSIMGDISGAEKMFRDGLALAEESGDQAMVALLSSNLGNMLYGRGDARGAQKSYENAQAIYRQMGDKDGVSMTAVNIGAVLSDQGDLKTAEKSINEAIALAAETGTKDLSGTSLLTLGQVQRDEGDLAAARKSVEQSLAIRNEIGEKVGAAETGAMLAVLALDEKDAARAAELAGKAVEEAHREKTSDLEAGALAVLAEADLGLKKIDAAREAIARAKAIASKSEERHVISSVTIAAARVTAASGHRDEAIASLEDVLAGVTKLGLVELEFEARLALGEIEIAAGKVTEGRGRLAELEKEAAAKGYLLYQRKAHEAAG